MDWICDDCYAGFTAKRYNPKPFEENEYTHSEIRYNHLVKTYGENKTVQLGGPTRGWAGQACAASKKMIDEAGKITIPVLVLQAGDDTAVTREGQNEFCNKLKKETGKACFGGGPKRFDGAKHELFIESDDYRTPAISMILKFYSSVE
jgi:lysophospholipase